MYHLLVYEEAIGPNAADSDLDAVVDPEFSQRNSHYIFSEDYQVVAALAMATSLTDARLSAATINAISRHHFFPFDRSATVISRPSLLDYTDYPIRLPKNEEVAVEASNNLGVGTENTTIGLFVTTIDWTRTLPFGMQTLVVQATAAPTSVAQAWSADGAITFETELRGGVYAVIGATGYRANGIFANLNFPRAPLVGGRKLRPGFVLQNAVGDVSPKLQIGGLGELGRFHTFEPPQLRVYASDAAATTIELRLLLRYLGEDTALLAG